MARPILTQLLITVTTAFAFRRCSAQICPSIAKALAPCQCHQEELVDQVVGISCEKDTDLKAVFERVSLHLVGHDFIFDYLTLSNQLLVELPANTITTLKFRNITLQYNQFLNFIHPDAFSATYAVTTSVDLGDNALITTPTNHDLFRFLDKFQAAEEISVHHNYIEEIPDDPFPEVMPNLKVLKFSERLSKLGSRMLANLPALESAQFENCEISLDSLEPDTFHGITGSQVDLNLVQNRFSQLPEQIFKPVLDSVAKLRVGGETCGDGACYGIPPPLVCDSVSAWLCDKEQEYRPKLEGFYCGNIIEQPTIWDWCHSENNNSSA